jgi:UDP-N-acetylglucosamine--N-acetylmuramyl-(pentapeptide) pyrophosphoryl-undecaprenol N-acetylglucosamine transferase
MTMRSGKLKVAVVSGPTGGHFFPGLAIGEGLIERGVVTVKFFVPRRRYLIAWLEKKGFEYTVIPEVRLSFRDFLFPVKFIYVFFRTCLFLSKERFNGIVVTGSYATVPFLLAAKLYRIKIFVHEQNFLPGKVTRLSVFIADRIALSFPFFFNLPKDKTVVTGFPIISDFKKRFSRSEVLREFDFSPDYITVLVLGGSQGAAFINEMVMKSLVYLKAQKIQFIHLAGRGNECLAETYRRHNIQTKVFDFYFDMAKLYSIADIVICRAGAGTLAEISEWKLPAIVVPYPYAGGHQKYNALYFAKRKSCILLEQNQKGIEQFPVSFEKVLRELNSLKQSLKVTSISDSQGNNVRQIMELLN